MYSLKRLLSSICLAFASITLAQLYPDQSGYDGDFESGQISSWYRNETSSFSLSSDDSYNGSYAMKVESSGNTLMFTTSNAEFDKQNGINYSVGFYLKGKWGNQITVSLKNAGSSADEVSDTQQIRNNEWSYYRFSLRSSSASSTGKVKIKFEDSGTYLIDAIALHDSGFDTWYVSPSGANNSTNGLSSDSPLQTINYALTKWEPGDLILLMDGEFQNLNYGTNNLNNNAVVSLDINEIPTSLYNPLVIRNYGDHKPVIRFDGSGGFISSEFNYLEISGLEIAGPNQNINYQQAINNRTVGNNYYAGRGIAIWKGHHININNNKIHDCPNSGIRVNNGDYCIVANNEVYNNTWWSPNAESAIVYATVKQIDDSDKIKMKMISNLVYNNINKIPFHKFGNNQCSGTDYGCSDYNKILDGNGCYVTRNNEVSDSNGNSNPNGVYNGYFYFANNVCYGNGVNGLVIHKTNNAIVTNNTIFRNGETPNVVDPNDPEEWKRSLSSGRQNWSGLTINNSSNVKVFNNIISARLASDDAFKVVVQNGYSPTQIDRKNNLIVKGECANWCYLNGDVNQPAFDYGDPLFVNEDLNDLDLSLQSSEESIAIDSGYTHTDLPLFDIKGAPRIEGIIDLGAYEYSNTFSFPLWDQAHQLMIYPNPSHDYIHLISSTKINSVSLHSLSGEKLPIIMVEDNQIDFRHLSNGIYFLTIQGNNIKRRFRVLKN